MPFFNDGPVQGVPDFQNVLSACPGVPADVAALGVAAPGVVAPGVAAPGVAARGSVARAACGADFAALRNE